MDYRQIPSYNWLRVFEAAARQQSFARAAKQLAMTPAAVSQQIKALESHLGQALFERGPHSVVLTRSGSAFLPVVQQSLRSIDTAAGALFGNPRQRPLSIQGSLMFTCSWLSARLQSFQRTHADVHLQISTADSAIQFEKLQTDLQISYGAGPKLDRDGDRLFGEYLYPVAAKSIARKVSSLSDVLDYRLIEVGSHRNSWMRVLESESDLDIDTVRFSFADNSMVAINMAASGLGIALARAPASDALCRQCNVVPCLEGFKLTTPQHYYLRYASASTLSAQAQEFREWILGQAELENKT